MYQEDRKELQDRLDLWPHEKVRAFETAQEFATAFLASEDADDLHDLPFDDCETAALKHWRAIRKAEEV